MRARRKENKKRRSKRKQQSTASCQPGYLVAPTYFIILSMQKGSAASKIDAYFAFISRLRANTIPSLRIDMSGVELMTADAALLFKAELSKLIEIRKVRVTAIPPNSDRTKQVLKQTSIDVLLNLVIDIEPDREDVVHWRIAEGPSTVVDPCSLSSIMADIESVTGLESHPIYQGIIESMANCVEHAYKPSNNVKRRMPRDPGWWVFQQVKDGILNVFVCDLGIGVRNSLPMSLAEEAGLYKKLMYIARKAKGEDNRSLLAAMEYGRTSTGQKQRGKGMRNAHNVIDEIGEGDFFAMSNAGCYLYSKKADKNEGTYRTIRLRQSIQGTILGWKVPLKSATGS